MKKVLPAIIISIMICINSVPIASSANIDATHLEIIAPTTAIVGEAFDVTVRAVDRDNKIVSTYRGSVIFSTDNIGDTIPAPGKTVTFTADENGEKKISKGFIFTKSGYQKIFVYDVSDEIMGEATVTVDSIGATYTASPSSTQSTNNDPVQSTNGGAFATSTPDEEIQRIMNINSESGMNSGAIQSTNTSSESEIVLESASEQNNYIYSSWELINRTPMLAGFVWTGEIANYITPAMYIGTPLASNQIYFGEINPFASFLKGNPTNYTECIAHEAYLSFGLGDLVEDTAIKELKAIAKACAKEYYGSYFNGKSYTTREEFLMMMFTLFEEDQVGFQGHFDEHGKYIKSENDGSITGYSNVNPKEWYSSYLKLADNLAILPIDETTWKIGKAISDKEVFDFLSLYIAYRMNVEGGSFDTGIITTKKMKYNFSFVDEDEMIIKIQ